MNRMKDKIVVVTGGSRGIGKSIVNKFAQEGAKVIFSISKNACSYDFENIKSISMDVNDVDSIESFVLDIKSKFGKIDVLINNAGIINDSLIEKIDDESWDVVLNTNLKGVFNFTRAIAPIMMENGYGSIVNISSVVGVYGNVGQTNYSASKAGIIGMSYTWAKEFTRKGANVRTNVVAPGYIDTDMMKGVPEKILESIKNKTPLKRLGTSEEVANAVLFLASDESSFVNGHVLEVNGGLRL